MAVDRRPIDQMVLDVGPEAFQRLVKLFDEETRGVVLELRRLFAAQDWRELGRQAHSLKHATSSFGLVELAEIAAQIEKAADALQPIEAGEQLTRLETCTAGELKRLALLLEKVGNR